MLDAIRRLLAAPTFADEEETRVAAILHTMLLGCAGISLVALVIQLVALEQTQAALLIYPAALACSLGLLTLVRRGLLQLAGSIFLLFLWAAITFGALTYGGIRSPSAGGHILVVIIATLLFSGRLVLMFVALSLATLAGILAVEELGHLPPRLTPDTPEVAFLAHFIHLFSAGFFLYLAVKNLQDARLRARQGAAKAADLLREATAAKTYADNILASMAESLVVIDPTGTIITVNKATLDLLGHAAEAVEQSLRQRGCFSSWTIV